MPLEEVTAPALGGRGPVTAPKLRFYILLSEDYLSETQDAPSVEILEPFGANLRSARSARGLTQEALADAAGMHRTAISLLELSKRDPQLSTIVKLAGTLRIAPLELLRGISGDPYRAEDPCRAIPGSVDPS